jgi:mannose-6-phosphate isomerase
MHPYPLTFEPILKEKVWGGRNLAALGKNLPNGALVGESWELADLPAAVAEGRSVVAEGPMAGRTLRQVIASSPEAIMGGAKLTEEGGFPLLVKFLDARENLSVQVHPDADYAREHPDTHLKSEAWFVVKADPGSVIYKGVRPDITRDVFARHIETGEVADDLVTVPVEPGDCHYLPSGTCHALGAGIVVAEIQTPSDTTFRVYDWGRQGRELHVQQALECITFGEPTVETQSGLPIEVGGARTTRLAKTDFFAIERIDALSETTFPLVTSGMPEVWMVIQGSGSIDSGSGPDLTLTRGTTILIPAALENAAATLPKGTTLLRFTTRSPIEGLLA